MQLNDAAILEVIAQLSARRGRAGIPALRAALKERFGASCGTDRLSRLLHQFRQTSLDARRRHAERAAQERQALAHTAPTEIATLQQQLAEALSALEEQRRRAELAEQREMAHQDKWANEIYLLRSRLAAVNPERALNDAKECEYLRVQNRHLSRLVSELRIALAQAKARTDELLEPRPPEAHREGD